MIPRTQSERKHYLEGVNDGKTYQLRDGHTISIPNDLLFHTKMLVLRFAEAMAEKLYKSQIKYGYIKGKTWAAEYWKNDCIKQFQEHSKKGDPLDVANYCAFMWHHGWNTAPPQPQTVREALEACKYDCNTGEVIGIAHIALSTTPGLSALDAYCDAKVKE